METQIPKTILLVEDDPISAKLVTRMVEKMGYHMSKSLATGEEAIELVQVSCPDLILMDIHLEGQLDGIETAQKIKELADVPIIYLTALGDPVTVQRAVSTEPFGYIMKPVQEPMLKSAIELAFIKLRGYQYVNDSRKWMANILNNINDALIVVDHKGKVSYINHAGFDSLPIHFEQSIGKPFHQIIPLFSDHHHIAFTNRQGDRRYIDLSYSLLMDSGSFEGVLWVIRDMTEHVLAKEALQLDESRLETLYAMTQMINKPNHTIIDFALEECVRLTRSRLGFLGFVNDQQDHLEIHSWSKKLLESDPERFSHTNPSVKRMPILDNVLQQRKTIIRNRLNKEDIISLPDGHIDLVRFMVIPIFDGPKMVAVASVANKVLAYNDADVRQITLLLNGMWRILEKKRIDDEVAYMSIHDSLTGLYNRGYFEEEMKRLSNGRQNPIGLIICDVDGLKTINDTYGHAFGDQLLVDAAKVLKASFRMGDMIARIGGDEFAILVPKTTEESMKRACQRLTAATDTHNRDNPDLPLHFSMGYSIRSYKQTSMESLFLAADNQMYQDKALKKQMVISPLTSTLCQIMEERGFFPKSYGDLLERWALVLAKEMEAPTTLLKDLPRFSRIHDIGKVGIPEKIVLKPTPLTDREFRKMIEHTEIGHKIAVSTPDLVSIADWVLNHHEWWNGKGYPNKLRGEEIPLACRLLSVVDTYLDMIYPWPHKKAAKWFLAYEHLQKHSGTQFEPRIVEVFLRMIRSHKQLQHLVIE